MAVDFSQFTRWIPLDFGSGMDMTRTLLWALIFGFAVAFLIIFIRNKVKYKYYGLVFKRRQESLEGIPQAMTIQGKAGYFKKKSGRTVFRIKWGFMPWQQVETSQLPDPKYMMGNTVILLQVQKDNFTQAKITVDWEGKNFTLEPIDDSLKFDAQLELSEIDRVLETKRISPVTVGLLIMGLILVTGIIVYYFLGKA